MDLPIVRSSSRLEAYSDALFAIVATVMIVPISHIKVPENEDLRYTFVQIILPQLVVYVFTFLVICQAWADHVWLFETISNVDEVIVLLNLALLMVITFLPFAFTLLGNYLQQALAINIFCATIIIVGCLQVIFIIYVFKNKESLLRPDILNSDNGVRWKSHRNSMLASVSTPAILAVISMILTSFSPIAADICLLLILLGNFIRRNLIKLYHHLIEKCRQPDFHISIEEETPLHQRLLSETLSKERIECFSDGVFSIVATLIILDICEDNVPDRDAVEKAGGLAAALANVSPVFVAYAGTFVTVALLWYVHHSLLYYIKELNRLMVLFNNLCLLSIGMMPFAFKLTSKYYANINCGGIFLAGIFQVAIYLVGLFSQNRLRADCQYGGRDHNYMCIKLLVIPLISLLVYGLSFGQSFVFKSQAFNGMQIGTLGVFLALQLANFCMTKHRKEQDSSGLDTSPFHASDLSSLGSCEPIPTIT